MALLLDGHQVAPQTRTERLLQAITFDFWVPNKDPGTNRAQMLAHTRI
jgi:hypothetical protein